MEDALKNVSSCLVRSTDLSVQCPRVVRYSDGGHFLAEELPAEFTSEWAVLAAWAPRPGCGASC